MKAPFPFLKNSSRHIKSDSRGSLLVSAIIFSFIFVLIGGALLSLMVSRWKAGLKKIAIAQALVIAEAGVNYYKWHLDNFPTDYADGTGQVCNPCGPYARDYEDPSGGTIGKYELTITPPPPGSTLVKIKSTGWTLDNPNLKRHIAVRYGKPSWAQYAILANSTMRFGSGTVIHGPVHVNGGVRFDGVAYNEITSAQETYNDTDSDACTVSSWGVHTCSSPADSSPPTVPPQRLDIFKGGRRYPVPSIDFFGISSDFSLLETQAKADGVYLNPSNKLGYHIQFLGNNTFQYRTVKTTSSACNGGNSPIGDITAYQGNWSVNNLPNNGIIFVEDNAWIDGTLNSSFITVVAAKKPFVSGLADVWINNDILYSAKDGSSGLGILAQKNVNIGLFSEDNLEVDAALIAQKGRVGRYYYPSSCSATYYKRGTITIYGSIGSNARYGFSWTCGGSYCSGYNIRNINYDTYLIYTPPPSFPTSGEYTFISWEELLPGESY